MDYRSLARENEAVPEGTEESRCMSEERDQLRRQLLNRAERLRDDGTHAAEFWLAEQYEMTAMFLKV